MSLERAETEKQNQRDRARVRPSAPKAQTLVTVRLMRENREP